MVKYKAIWQLQALYVYQFWHLWSSKRYICEMCYSDIFFTYTIYACMLAERLKKAYPLNANMTVQHTWPLATYNKVDSHLLYHILHTY